MSESVRDPSYSRRARCYAWVPPQNRLRPLAIWQMHDVHMLRLPTVTTTGVGPSLTTDAVKNGLVLNLLNLYIPPTHPL